MDDLKQAYQTMGLPEFAEKDEVEKRYTTLLRKERARSKINMQEAGSEGDPPEQDFDRITQAYRLILDYEDRKITEAFNEQEYGKYKKLSGQAQKLDHFWRYYKYHTLGAIAAVALIIYAVIGFIDHQEEKKRLASLPPIDLSISFMGSFAMEDNSTDYEQINEALLLAFPEWKRFDTSITYVPQDEMNQYVYLQKAVVTLATETPDIYIMDKFMFEWIGGQGAFLNLDDEAGLNSLGDGLALKLGTVEDETEHIYGIDLTHSDLAKVLPIYKKDLIAGIRVNAKHPEKALEFVRKYAWTASRP